MAVSNLTVLEKKKHKGWSGPMAFPFFTTIIALKLIGLLGSTLLITVVLFFRMSDSSLAIQIPEVHFRLDTASSLSLASPSPIVTPISMAGEKEPGQNLDAIETDVVPMLIPTEGVINSTLSFSATPEMTRTLTSTTKPTETLAPTATITHTPTLTPFVSTFGGMMYTPLKGIPFEDLESIISQPFIQGIESRDIGHHAVDFGSYDYKGKNIINWPIQAVFPGRVASVVNDRTPLGHAIIIETPHNELPKKIAELIGIKPDQSLYQLYGHMVERPVYEIGDYIDGGEIIGLVGTSRTVEAHLHYETRIGPPNVILEGFAYYSGDITPDEKANYERFRMSGEFKSFDPMIIFYSAQR